MHAGVVRQLLVASARVKVCNGTISLSCITLSAASYSTALSGLLRLQVVWHAFGS
jgi:hypothetical protein